MAHDGDLHQRFIAIAASEGIADPEAWVNARKWEIAAHDKAQGGLLDAYQYAVDTDTYRIKMYGKDPGIINDAMILSVVQALNTPTAP